MLRWSVVRFLFITVGMSVAQTWDIEAVDSVYPDQSVFLRYNTDGRMMLCYQKPDTSIVVAWKDTVWHRDSVPATGWLTNYQVGPHGEEAVCARFSTETIQLATRNDNVWQMETLDFRPYPISAACAFDTAGWPQLAFGYYVPGGDVNMIFFQKSEAGWQEIDTWPDYGPMGLWTDQTNRAVLLAEYYFEFPTERMPWHTLTVSVSVRDQDTWRVVRSLSSWDGLIAATSVGFDTAQGPHLAGYVLDNTYPPDSGFYVDDVRLDNRMRASALAYDRLNRVQLACRLDANLEHRFLGGGEWHKSPIPGAFSGPMDMLVDTNNQPVILAQDARVLYLIQGRDIIGLNAVTGSTYRRFTAGVYIRRGTSLTCEFPSRLVDITGRTVLSLHPGQNSVRLSPGIYYQVTYTQTATRIVLLP